jgi:glutamyl-tRNA(Gln) amidotransferase subunit E
MTHTEELEPVLAAEAWEGIRERLKASDTDALVLLWGPEEDIPTALETVEERCRLAFEGVPRESRKSFADGTTVFERVLPGPNRMYPDTDSVPISLEDDTIAEIRGRLPLDVSEMITRMTAWEVPRDTFPYILRNNLFPLLARITEELEIDPVFAGTLFGHTLKHVEGRYPRSPDFRYETVYDLLARLREKGIDPALAREMIPELYLHPQMDVDSILATLKFRRIPEREILDKIPYLCKIAEESGISEAPAARTRWMMGQLRPSALGNISLPDLYRHVRETNGKREGKDSVRGDAGR